ncbi:MAG: histidine triad nucleotide-binding protein [Candidatus Omnitrophica bacterium]|nr:histidine triad nucleotide-binding protein [Candidatus Omnitrophota bacterium]MCM8793759.1 histidine triad nucleotide-binding protein [Candidatus Omnitrophota bacterium]
MEKDCIFCKISRKEIPSKMVYADEEVLAFEDINPQAPVHIVIIPKKHIEKTSDITEGDIGLIGKLVFVAQKIAKEKNVSDSGYRLVFNCNKDAGQAVFHIHLHLLGGRKFFWPPG